MKRLRAFVVIVLVSFVVAMSVRAVSTVDAQDAERPNGLKQLKQIIEAQQKKILSLEARLAKLEETHRILRFDQYVIAAKAAKEISAVEPSGKVVMPKTKLKARDQVLVQWSDSWWKGQVVKILPDGNVKIHYDGWDAEWDEVVPRSRLRIPVTETAKPKE